MPRRLKLRLKVKPEEKWTSGDMIVPGTLLRDSDFVVEEVPKTRRKGKKRKMEPGQFVNDEETRRKNREAQARSRKRRKLKAQERGEEYVTLQKEVKTLRQRDAEQSEEIRRLREEVLSLKEELFETKQRTQQEQQAQKKVQTPKSAVFNSAAIVLSPQWTLVDLTILTLILHSMLFQIPIFLPTLLQLCSQASPAFKTCLINAHLTAKLKKAAHLAQTASCRTTFGRERRLYQEGSSLSTLLDRLYRARRGDIT